MPTCKLDRDAMFAVQPGFVVSHDILDSLELQESKEWLSNHTTDCLVAQPLFAFLELQTVQLILSRTKVLYALRKRHVHVVPGWVRTKVPLLNTCLHAHGAKRSTASSTMQALVQRWNSVARPTS